MTPLPSASRPWTPPSCTWSGPPCTCTWPASRSSIRDPTARSSSTTCGACWRRGSTSRRGCGSGCCTCPGASAARVWVDDERFDLEFHLRRSALPEPGGHDELSDAVGRILSRQLDRAKPLWELYVFEGMEKGRTAVLLKLHHAMADGIAGMRDRLGPVRPRARGAASASPSRGSPSPRPARRPARRTRSSRPSATRSTALRAVVDAPVPRGRGRRRHRRRRPRDRRHGPPPGGPVRRPDRSEPPLRDGRGAVRAAARDPRQARRHDQRRRVDGGRRGAARPAAARAASPCGPRHSGS